MENLPKQTQKNTLETHRNQKLEKTLGLAKAISSGEISLVKLEMNLTIVKTLNQPTIRSITKLNGALVFGATKFLVKRFTDSFGFSTKHTDSQIEMITVDALENMQFESLVDLVIFFKMCRSGKFGTTSRGLDSNLIFGTWLPMYLEKKSEIREKEYLKIKDKRTKEKNVTEEKVKSFYDREKEDREKEINKKLLQQKIDFITKDFDKQMLEDLITDWSKDEKMKLYLHLLKTKRKTIK